MTQVACYVDTEEQIALLVTKYPDLHVSEHGEEKRICGTIFFHRTYKDIEMEGEYEIEIRLSNRYPDSLPRVFETGGKIDKRYHHLSEGDLCLGTPTEVDVKFQENPSLQGFVDDIVVPYLFSHACFIKYGKMPYGERPHGIEGILHYYSEFFKTNDLITLKMLKMLACGKISEYWLCPCGSGRIIAECHALDFSELQKVHDSKYFLSELEKTIELFPPEEVTEFRRLIYSKKRRKISHRKPR